MLYICLDTKQREENSRRGKKKKKGKKGREGGKEFNRDRVRRVGFKSPEVLQESLASLSCASRVCSIVSQRLKDSVRP